MATDNFASSAGGIQAPGKGAFSITASDSDDLSQVTRGIYVGTSGNLAVIMADDTEVTFNSLSAGIVHPLRVKRVKSTSTTASNILGIY